MQKIERATTRINEILAAATRPPVVLLSFGADSMLVLKLARELDANIQILSFLQDFSPTQMRHVSRVVEAWDLEVYSYAPANRYFLPASDAGDAVCLVDEYSFGGFRVPVIRDFAGSDSECCLELSDERLAHFPFQWNTVLTGWRRGDGHFTTGQDFWGDADSLKLNEIEFFAPLFDWTREEVLEACRLLAIPIASEWYDEKDERFDTGNVAKCAACITAGDSPTVYCPRLQGEVERMEWNRGLMLDTFRAHYGFLS